jgi:hypothetical protein
MTLRIDSPKKIPSHLIYEMDEGKPIYYRWYKEFLNENEQNEETMPESSLQAWLKSHLAYLMITIYQQFKGYVVTAGEQGLSLKKKTWRGVDVAIFNRNNFVLNNEFAKLPPDYIIEINIKGYYESKEAMERDFTRKNQQLLEFGVKKVIWIFTDSQAVISITKEGETAYGWKDEVPVMAGVSFCVQALIDKYYEE